MHFEIELIFPNPVSIILIFFFFILVLNLQQNLKAGLLIKKYFDPIIDGMQSVIKGSEGTAKNSIIQDIEICGKTGTAQNPHGKDHSIFIAFAPKEDPKIAIAVYVENGGWGSDWAAPIASLAIEKYLTKKIIRNNLEKYIIKGNLLQ